MLCFGQEGRQGQHCIRMLTGPEHMTLFLAALLVSNPRQKSSPLQLSHRGVTDHLSQLILMSKVDLSCLLCCYKCTTPWQWRLWCELTHLQQSGLGSLLCMWFIFCVLGAKPKYQAKAVTKSALTKAPQKSDTTKTSRWVMFFNIIMLISVFSHCFLCSAVPSLSAFIRFREQVNNAASILVVNNFPERLL